jgi:RNA polymerase sigma factor (sigma-70 family)
MRTTSTNDAALVVAARSGDRRALDDLVAVHLPLVYTLVRRALGAHPDVDDLVQEIMLRAMRQLPLLRDPERFRAWLATIAMRRVSRHLYEHRVAAARTADLDEAIDMPDVDAEIEGPTLLRVELSAQRRQVAQAGQWLDPDDRALLSLWWLETAGQVSRAELAAALGLSAAHAGVRVQRMRHQLDLSRSVVAALSARPRCARLGALVSEWDGVPSPLWRKRLARHARVCARCDRASAGMVAAERLLVGWALLPVPLAVTAAVFGKSAVAGTAVALAPTVMLSTATGAGASGGAGAVAKAGIVGQLMQAIGAHPVAASLAAGALVVGTAVTATQWPAPVPPKPAVIAEATTTPSAVAPPRRSPTPTVAVWVPPPPPVVVPPVAPTGSPTIGPVSLESANAAGRFVATAGDLGVLVPIGADGDAVRELATFEAVRGLADANCLSLRAADGRYLRHMMWRVRLSPDEGTPLFRGDATFCVRPGSVAGSVWLESSNYPGWFLRHRGDEVWVDHSDRSEPFQADSSFLIRPPLAG